MKTIISGAPGTGKTTLIKKLYKLNPSLFRGFWTEEIREHGKRVGFRIVRTDGKSGILSHVDLDTPYKVGRYKVDIEGFERLIMPILKNPKGILLIDEIGKMELFSKKFQELIEAIMFKSNVDVVATIPIKDVHPLVRRIRRKYKPFEITMSNRDTLFEFLKDRIFKHR